MNYSLFDVLPTRIRKFHHVNAVATALAAIALNATLILLLATERNVALRAYARVIAQNCLVDVVFAVVALLTEMQFEFTDAHMVLVVNGALARLPLPYHHACQFFYDFTFGMALLAPPIIFYYRYALIVRGKTLSNRQICQLFSLMVVTSLVQACMFIRALQSGDQYSNCRHFLAHEIWRYGGEEAPKCMFITLDDPLLIAFCAFSLITDIVVFIIMAVCTLTVMQHLKRCATSQYATKLQNQMNAMLIAQMILPLFASFIPVAALCTLPFARVRAPGAGLLVNVGFAWVPLVAPLTTLAFVGALRRRLLRPLLGPFARRALASKKTLASKSISYPAERHRSTFPPVT